MYAVTSTRREIAFTINQCASFYVESFLLVHAATRILQYFKATKHSPNGYSKQLSGTANMLISYAYEDCSTTAATAYVNILNGITVS